MAGFLSIERLGLGPWQAFERSLQRLFIHMGFSGVDLVGQVGDEGADVVGAWRNRVWVAQAKFRSNGGLIGTAAIDEVTVAVDRYGAQVAVVATNTGFSDEAIRHAKKRSADVGIPYYLWNGSWLLDRYRSLPMYPHERNNPRPYQAAALDAINRSIWAGQLRGLLLMATGLGKTRVAAGVIEQWVNDHPTSECLVLVPALALVPQFERGLWPFLPKTISTHVLTGAEKPTYEGGVTIATEQSALRRGFQDEARFGLVVVDEAHHAPALGFTKLLDDLQPTYLLGLTATPWRGDQQQLNEVFGPPTYSISVVEGMQLGYLAQIDYRMLLDSIDWNWVHSQLKGAVTVRDLNRHLFVPERDEALIQKIRGHIEELKNPRVIIFCRSITHAQSVTRLLRADGYRAKTLHSRLDKKETTKILHSFRIGELPILVAVDMLNEGIDVPDVNLIIFLRVTHSRRIFVQQLGRGLRLAPRKSVVRVLDFVSDIRRLGAGMDLNREAERLADRSSRDVVYPTGEVVRFENDTSLSFFNEYLADVAELAGEDDSSVLKFPVPS